MDIFYYFCPSHYFSQYLFKNPQTKPVNPKGNQHSIFIIRTNAEAEASILWLPDMKSWVIRKDPDAGKDWRLQKKMTEDEMVGWHHRLNGHGFGWTLGVGDGQGGLVCCSPWGCKESDMTKGLKNNNNAQQCDCWIIWQHYFYFF